MTSADRERCAQVTRFEVKPTALAAAVALTVGVTAAMSGGFDAHSQAWFAAMAGSSLFLAVAVDAPGALLAARSGTFRTLVAVALLTLASAAWTIGSSSLSLRVGLTVAGYAAVFVSSVVLTRWRGPGTIAFIIAILAFAEALLGVAGVIAQRLPLAEVIGGEWRPGGSFEYPPALAIMQAAALPIYARILSRCRSLSALMVAPAAVLAGAALALVANRLAVGLSVVLMLALLRVPQAIGVRRAGVLVAVLLVGAGALLSIALRSQPARSPEASARSVAAHRNGSRHDDILHGRAHEFAAAVETWLDRPLLGAGAGSYLRASSRHQGARPVLFAHDLPLELAAELGILGAVLGVALYLVSGKAVLAARGSAATLLAPMLVVFLASNLIDWTWHLAALGAMWAAAAGGLEASR